MVGQLDHNFIHQSLNSGSAQVQLLYAACRTFAMMRISGNVPTGNKAKQLSPVNHTTKQTKKTTWSILNRLKKPSYIVIAEHDVKFKKLRHERAAARTDVRRKCKLLASFYHSTDIVLHFFYPFEAWALCNSLRIILIFFNSHSKNCEVKKL